MRNLKELTNEELIKTYKEHKCSLKSIEKDFGLGKNAAGRLFNKRNIDYNKIKEEENLQLLCPNCHSLTETFGSLNKESSRIYRKQKENI